MNDEFEIMLLVTYKAKGVTYYDAYLAATNNIKSSENAKLVKLENK